MALGDCIVRPVHSRADRRRFVEFPWQLYRDDPNWIPPLIGHHQELLGYRHHPFYDNAESQTFLAWRDQQVVGRIAAIVNREHNRVHEEQRGFFGWFESIDDRKVAAALFDAARDWLARRQIYQIRGPANPSMNYECGLLVEGFHMPPTFMMTYNPPYYAKLIESCGFHKEHDLLSYVGTIDQLPAAMERLGGAVEKVLEYCNATVRHTNWRQFSKDVELFVDLYNRSLAHMWGFVPLPPREMRAMCTSLRHLVVPDLVAVAESQGKGAGCVIALPDFNPTIKRINGRLFPFGFMRLLAAKRRNFRRTRVISTNVVPEFQRFGLSLALMFALVPKGLALGMREAEFSWVSETNDLARMGLEKGGTTIEKRHRMYDSND
jgi:hypothetical protein